MYTIIKTAKLNALTELNKHLAKTIEDKGMEVLTAKALLAKKSEQLTKKRAEARRLERELEKAEKKLQQTTGITKKQ